VDASPIRLDDSAARLGDDHGMDADHHNLDQLLASYYRMCAEAGVEPLPDAEAGEQAAAIMALLAPAFEVSFRQH
jgi:hypothetical protein